MIDCSDISVVIPVHNGGESFTRCLDSLRSIRDRCREIIVVADGDSDNSWQRAQQFGAAVIRLSETGGPARARNAGARAASGAVLFFMDADVCLHPDTLPKVATAFAADPDLAALIGSYDDEPGAGNFLSQYRNLLHHYTHQMGSEAGICLKKSFLALVVLSLWWPGGCCGVTSALAKATTAEDD